MNEVQRERALKLRVGIFVIVALLAFLGTIYALGARARLFESRYTIYADFTQVAGLVEGATVRLAGVQIGRVTGVRLPPEPGGRVRVVMSVASRYANRVRRDSTARIATQGLLGDKIVEITLGTADAPTLQSGEAIATRDPFEMGDAITEGAQTIKSVTALAEALRQSAETLNRSGVVEDAASALRKLNDTLVSTQALLDRVQRGEGAVGVLTSAQSTAAAKRLVALMERLGKVGDRPSDEDGLLAALLFDPKYRAILDEVRETAHNLRVVSDRVLGGRGTLGGLVKDEPDDGGLRPAVRDLRVALANFREITTKINEGEGTIGGLVVDPTVYEQLVTVLEGAQRSAVLRFLIRGLGQDRKESRP
jgi:phospholipid/cholesterol/gamma-HCH transport system substrate-binding protein